MRRYRYEPFADSGKPFFSPIRSAPKHSARNGTIPMREQRRGRKIAMTRAEIDAYLAEERTCRVATSGPGGPHLTALWFAWDGAALWLNSVVKSQRWTDLARDPRAAVLIDGGREFTELCGVEIRGRLEPVGD